MHREVFSQSNSREYINDPRLDAGDCGPVSEFLRQVF